MPEIGWNAMIAGMHDVPVIFVSGDRAVCEQAGHIIPSIHTVAVKEGIGQSSLNLHPSKAATDIRNGVIKALQQREKIKPFKLPLPLTVKISFKNENHAFRAAWYPGSQRIDALAVSFTGKSVMDCLRFFMFVS